MMDAEGQAEIERLRAVIAAIDAELRVIYREGILPDGDGVNVSTARWAGDAIKHTAQLAADHDAAVRADERRKVLEEVKQMAELWAEQEIDTVTHNAAMGVAEWAERQLAAQPEESING